MTALLSALELKALAAATERDGALRPAQARQHGIVHTPPELARFMVRAVDDLLRGALEVPDGLSEPSLALVDPACGPGAFLAALGAVHQASGGQRPLQVHAWDRDPVAIELLRTRLGEPLRDARVRCALHVGDTLSDVLPETVAGLGGHVCVLGNPPWIGRAQPPAAAWLEELLEDFRRDEHSVRLSERKLGVLSDAYVRFMRWACEVALHARRGALVALVTNASYLDGPVHRGMRGKLERSFDHISIVDLGGSALLARGVEIDENVFRVRPSVALLFGVRRGPARGDRHCELRYTRLLGTRRDKLERLASCRLADLRFAALGARPPFRRFVPDPPDSDAYQRGLPLHEAMPFHREGVQTNRDAVTIDRDPERLLARARAFAAGERRPELEAAELALPHYEPSRARAALIEALARDPDGDAGVVLRALIYRPFDVRWFVPVAPLCHRPRPDLLSAMDRSELALVTVRKDRGELPYHHLFAARAAIDNCLLSNRSSCRARAFPTHDPSGAENLSAEAKACFVDRTGVEPTALAFIHYALAALGSPEFRRRHRHALQLDYPRIPLPRDRAQFEARVRAGAALCALWTAPLTQVVTIPALAAVEPAFVAEYVVGHHRPLRQALRDTRPAAEVAALRARCERIAALLASLDAL